MRLIGLIVSGALAVAVVAEGAYIIHTRRQVDRLSDRLEAIGQEAEDPLGGLDVGRMPARGRDLDEGGALGLRPARNLPPPRLVATPPTSAGAPSAPATDDPLPLPPAIDTREGREQLRRFVVASMERERDENRLKDEQRQQEREKARRERMVSELGLSPPEAEKFDQIMGQVQNLRSTFRSRIESGQLPREAIGREMAAVREQTEKQLRDLLGDDRMKKLEEMRGPGRGGPMQGGGGGGERRRWGGPRGQGGPGAAPGAAPGPGAAPAP